MTADQYTELIDFLGGKFGRIDARFDALETRFDAFETRFDALETRFDALETRFDALETRFDALETRFDALDGRVARVEVGLEALRHDVQILGEGLTATNQRLDRYHEDHERRIRALEDRWLQH